MNHSLKNSKFQLQIEIREVISKDIIYSFQKLWYFFWDYTGQIMALKSPWDAAGLQLFSQLISLFLFI